MRRLFHCLPWYAGSERVKCGFTVSHFCLWFCTANNIVFCKYYLYLRRLNKMCTHVHSLEGTHYDLHMNFTLASGQLFCSFLHPKLKLVFIYYSVSHCYSHSIESMLYCYMWLGLVQLGLVQVWLVQYYDWSNCDWSKYDWSKCDWFNWDWSKCDWSNIMIGLIVIGPSMIGPSVIGSIGIFSYFLE